MVIYLIRHAQTEANKNGIIQGQFNTKITKEGLKKAKIMAKSFSQTELSMIYSSPIKRALITARLIGRIAGIKSEDIVKIGKLKEINLEPWVFKRIVELDNSDSPSSYKTYKTHPSEFVPLSGESLLDVKVRVSEAYKQIIEAPNNKGDIAIVSHSVAIRTLLSHIEGKGIDNIWNYRIPPASITEIYYDGKTSIIKKIGVEVI